MHAKSVLKKQKFNKTDTKRVWGFEKVGGTRFLCVTILLQKAFKSVQNAELKMMLCGCGQ